MPNSYDKPVQKPRRPPGQVSLIPVGGCGEFGMNMTCLLYDRRIYLIDAGFLFPDPQMLGVQSIIPNLHKVLKSDQKLDGYIITHGHEDHIGALPYIYSRWPAPIWAPRWTSALIEKKFAEKGITKYSLTTVNNKDRIKLQGNASVEYIRVNHSIPDAFALMIRVADTRIFHTGDFKIDLQSPYEDPIDLNYLKSISDKEGVTLLLADSTNAHKPGPTPSEVSVIEPMKKVIQRAPKRVFVTTFASNLWRLISLAKICQELGHKLVLSGAGIRFCLELADKLGLYRLPKGLVVDERKAAQMKQKVVVLISGSQGEPNSALFRLAEGSHRNLSIHEGDTVVFSSRLIPGNEKQFFRLLNELRKRGADVITDKEEREIHVSGHAYSGDLVTLLKTLRPKFYVPVHGTFWNLSENCDLVHSNEGIKSKQILVEDGSVIVVNKQKASISNTIAVDQRFVDSDSQRDMSKAMLAQRLKLGELGLAVLSGVISQRSRRWVRGPELELVGIPGPDAKKTGVDPHRALIDELRIYPEKKMGDVKLSEEAKCVEKLRNFLKYKLYHELQKKPVVMVKVSLI